MVLLYVAGTFLYKAVDIIYQQQQLQQQQEVQQQQLQLQLQQQQQQQQQQEVQQQQLQQQQEVQQQQHLQKSKLVIRTTQLIVIAFGLSDWIDYGLFPQQAFPVWRLPPLAFGFGMINAASGHLFGGAVTNAITGHMSKLGMGLAESLLMMAGGSSSSKSHPSSSALLRTTAWGLATFCLSLVTTLGLLRVVEGQQEQSTSWLILERLPPLGLSLGLVYGTLFTGYSKYLMRLSEQQQRQQQQQQQQQ
jgi:hypothetical protein